MELKFASTNEALQHLADITGAKIIVAAPPMSLEDIDTDMEELVREIKKYEIMRDKQDHDTYEGTDTGGSIHSLVTKLKQKLLDLENRSGKLKNPWKKPSKTSIFDK